MLCVKCQKRPAVVFVQRLENGKTVQEGYCLTCAPFDYDLRSRHAALLGGSGDYLCTKQQELDDITRFMRSWRD